MAATTLRPARAPFPATRFSVEEYHRWGEADRSDRRTELIRGFIVERVPPSPPHVFYVRRLSRTAEAAVGPGLLVRKEESLTLVDSEPMPDLAVVEGEETDFFHVHPATALLAVEVCISGQQRDRQKLELYAEADIPEYWIIFPEEQRINVHTAPRDGRHTHVKTFGAGETVVCGTVPGLRVVVDEFLRV